MEFKEKSAESPVLHDRKNYALCAVDTLQHWELKRILRALHGQNVDVLLLKGAYLKNKVYKNPARRPMADIDILIKKSQKESALSVVMKMGYEDIHKHSVFAEGERGVVELFRKDEMLTHQLDLHTELVNLPGLRAVMNIPETLAWNESEKISVDGCPCYGMRPELLLLYLCYHVSLHHGFYGSMRYEDLQQVLNAHEKYFSWEHFFELVKNCRMQRVAYFTLKESGLEKYCKANPAFASIQKSISAREKSLMQTLLEHKKQVHHEDYVLAVFLIDGGGRRMRFSVSYAAAWLRFGARNGGGGTGFALKHIASRFFRLCGALLKIARGGFHE